LYSVHNLYKLLSNTHVRVHFICIFRLIIIIIIIIIDGIALNSSKSIREILENSFIHKIHTHIQTHLYSYKKQQQPQKKEANKHFCCCCLFLYESRMKKSIKFIISLFFLYLYVHLYI
jgi:hypothetical protein